MSAILQDLAPLAWQQFWQVTLVAGVALLAARLFCRRRPHLAYVLLLLVIIKSLVPPLWGSPLGVFSRLPVRQFQTASFDSTGIPVEAHAPTEQTSTVNPVNAAPVIQPTGAQPVVDATATPTASVSWSAMLLIAWATGAMARAGCIAVGWTRQRRAIRLSTMQANGDLLALHAELSRRLGLWRPVRLWVSSATDGNAAFGPLCFGLLKPTVVLPAAMLSPFDRERIEPILAHELIHVRRGDPWTALAQVLATIVWWFHPLIWRTSQQLSRQREKCCDEAVVAITGCNRGCYAQELINILQLSAGSPRIYLGTGIRPVEITQERLEAIMSDRGKLHRHTPWFCWTALALGVILLIPGQGSIVRAAAGDAFSADLSVAEFARLGEQEQLDYLKKAVLAFQKKTSNISFTATEVCKNVEFDRVTNRIGTQLFVLGGVPQTCDRRTTSVWRIGGSYRSQLTQEPTMPRILAQPIPILVNGFDAKTGEQTGWIGPKPYGWIQIRDIGNDASPSDLFSEYLMGGSLGEQIWDLHGRFLKGFPKAKISRIASDAGTVEVSFSDPDKSSRTIRVIFDLTKQATLVALKFGNVPGEGDKPHEGYGGEIAMLNLTFVDGVWLPMQIRAKVADTSNKNSDVSKHVTIYDNSLTFVELGKVTEADLKVVFPPGTQVHDFIHDKEFTVATDGPSDSSTGSKKGAEAESPLE